VGARDLDLRRPLIMGVVNVTPDSFSDGGAFLDPARATAHALALCEQGADILDIGGESTRPGAADVPAAEELARVLPVVEAIRRALPHALLSIDTRKAAVAAPCLAAGAQIINDVSGFCYDDDLPQVVARAHASAVLMHMRGTPATMLHDTRYDDLFDAISSHLRHGLSRAAAAGIPTERVALDPGIGFAKDLSQNLTLIANLHRLLPLGRPLLLGVSRKRFIGALTHKDDPADRAFGTAAAVTACVLHGASILRVHDVAQARDAILVAAAIRDAALASPPRT
jgi:dihydropteroate synthase